MGNRVPRLSRRALVAGAAGAAIAAVSVRDALSSGGGKRYPAAVAFTGAPDREGWGAGWHLQHYQRRLFVRGGRGVLELPAGLTTTAPDQPTPVFLLDRACRDCLITLAFSVQNATARPGVILGATSTLDYLAVTAEAGRLVLARYVRARREVIATAASAPIRAGTPLRLEVRLSGGRLQARLGTPSDPGGRQLDAGLTLAAAGTLGVVLVHPTDLQPAALLVERFSADAPEPFAPTRPAVTYLLAGIPDRSGAGTHGVLLRAGSGYPALVRFEWAENHDWGGPSGRSDWLSALEPPYTAIHRAALPTGAAPYWRARLRSPTSGRETVSAVYQVPRLDVGAPLVMLAASCIEFWDMPPTYGFERMAAAGPAPPAALVFQGDMGYANNKFHSCYLAEADYFADRFTRFLADPRFAALRGRVPVGFTMDDHDYGPRNNADRTTVRPWSYELWNRMHADPSADGYFDFRVGDVHCLTLDGRRYADPVWHPNRPGKTKLGARQLAWMRSILETSDAGLFVIFSADTFASRFLHAGSNEIADCFISGWPGDYERAMTLFAAAQARGRRVVIMSGDAHSLRIHYHPPGGTQAQSYVPIVEFVCSGLRPRHLFGAATGDPTVDPLRHVIGRAGGGMIAIDPPATPSRTVTLRAITGEHSGDPDVFPPLVLPAAPTGPIASGGSAWVLAALGRRGA
jgi:hypothetical protein